MEDRRVDIAVRLMDGFADDTGLRGEKSPKRYLWTDAFAVCVYLALYERSGETIYRELAHRLVDQVHAVLGRHRPDDSRHGWLSGLAETEGWAHPTMAGLRIGKRLPERGPEDAFDPQLEWERDGQYFHYLTKWMQALHCLFAGSGQESYQRWAVELAKVAHRRFVGLSALSGKMHLHWKMRIDLSEPLVPAMGQHDPLDGYLTFLELAAAEKTDLSGEIADLERLCRQREWATDDPLGLGGLLCDCLRAARLGLRGDERLLDLAAELLRAAGVGLEQYVAASPLRHPAEFRLAFRELGLAIGLHGLDWLRALLRASTEASTEAAARGIALQELLESLTPYGSLAGTVERFWCDERARQSSSWREHREINTVMLAAALLPEGWLGCGAAGA